MDVLYDVIAEMRLTGGIFLEAEFTAPWCITAQVGPEDCAPFGPLPRTLIAYHYVRQGRLVVDADGPRALTVEGGEIVVLPGNDRHTLSSGGGLTPVGADRLIVPAEDGGLARIVHGGGGETTTITCGFLGCEGDGEGVLAMLPRVLKLDVTEGASGEWIESSFRFAVEEAAAGRFLPSSMMTKLAELLFAEAVRRYLHSQPEAQTGWLAGMRDPVLRRALTLLHRRIDHHWTAAELAREAGLSRSAFAARFTCAMGEPPMRYLARRRLHGAARRLVETREPIPSIAFSSGYESEAAFSRAFKRAFGAPPGTWRRTRGQVPGIV